MQPLRDFSADGCLGGRYLRRGSPDSPDSIPLEAREVPVEGEVRSLNTGLRAFCDLREMLARQVDGV